ncbi:MAG: hypothetical protein LBH80_06440 [Prevotellaceae bacterium]|jgi:hypothetical protein|nr:hypothetical protein [Prevotellaceae bacterium]
MKNVLLILFFLYCVSFGALRGQTEADTADEAVKMREPHDGRSTDEKRHETNAAFLFRRLLDDTFPAVSAADGEKIAEINFGHSLQFNVVPEFVSERIKKATENSRYYVLGMVKSTNRPDCDYLLVRAVGSVSDNADVVREDFLLPVVNDVVTEPLSIGFWSSSPHVNRSKSYYFDDDGSVTVVSTENSTERNEADIPLQIKTTRSYTLGPDAVFALSGQRTDTLLNPSNFRQLKSGFPYLKRNQTYSEDTGIRLAYNECTQACFVHPEQKTYIVGKLHYQNDTDFLLVKACVDRGMTAHTGKSLEMHYVLVCNNGRLENCTLIGTNVQEPGKTIVSESHFDDEMNLVTHNKITNYDVNNGFHLPVNISYEYKRTFFFNQFVEGAYENMTITSPYFEIDNIVKSVGSNSYPTKTMPWNIYETPLDKASNGYKALTFYLVPSSRNGYCVQFIVRKVAGLSDEKELIDETCLCRSMDYPQEHIMKSNGYSTVKNFDTDPVRIVTDKGEIIMTEKGTFKMW